MKDISCEVVQDLLPLYCDGICSRESRAIIENHLPDCPDCRRMLENMGAAMPEAENSGLKAAASYRRKLIFRVLLGSVGAAVCILLAAVCIRLYPAYLDSYRGDAASLEKAVESMCGEECRVERLLEDDRYRIAAFQTEKGAWGVYSFQPSPVLHGRWVLYAGIGDLQEGKLYGFQMTSTDGNAWYICFGVGLSPDITGYSFTSGGVVYTVPVYGQSVLDVLSTRQEENQAVFPTPIYKSGT